MTKMNGDDYMGIIHVLAGAKRRCRYGAEHDQLARMVEGLGQWFEHSNERFDRAWWERAFMDAQIEGAVVSEPPSRMYPDGPPDRYRYSDYMMGRVPPSIMDYDPNSPAMIQPVPYQRVTRAELAMRYGYGNDAPPPRQAPVAAPPPPPRPVSITEYEHMTATERRMYQEAMMRQTYSRPPLVTWQTSSPIPDGSITPNPAAEALLTRMQEAIESQLTAGAPGAIAEITSEPAQPYEDELDDDLAFLDDVDDDLDPEDVELDGDTEE